MSASAGVSRLKSRQRLTALFLEPDAHGVLRPVLSSVYRYSGANTSSYSLSLQRQFERWRLDATGSRALQPSGFGALATQDDLTFRAIVSWTERLNLSAAVHESRLSDSTKRLNLSGRRYYDLNLGADWRWTQLWQVQLQTSAALERPTPNASTRTNIAVFLSMSRQLGRTNLN